jgi:hypothetical protein
MSRWFPVAKFGMPLLVLGVFLSGCGGGVRKVKITGKVLNNGQPLKITEGKGEVRITLLPVVEPGQPYDTFRGKAGTDGSFEIPDVPAGKYRVGIEHLDPSPQEDQMRGRFAPNNSKIIRDLDGKASLDLDVSKPTG